MKSMAETFLYITLGTNDVARAARFYDAALAPLGLIRRATHDDEVGYGFADDSRTRLWITRPYDGKPATVGNGSMPALVAMRPWTLFTRLPLPRAEQMKARPDCAPMGQASMPPMSATPMATSSRPCAREGSDNPCNPFPFRLDRRVSFPEGPWKT
jgi:hypothetical protein